MAHSGRLKSNSLLVDIKKILLSYIRPTSHLTIALSGGIDSVVLLHILAMLSKQMEFTLSAVHVNHGISRNAAIWSRFCCNLCYIYGISIDVTYLNIKKESGVSLEAHARDERYRIFAQVQADYVILAQHLDDQAETLLIQLLRGAGIKGLRAMPVIRKLTSSDAKPQILRPLLEITRSRIEAYARKNKLNWINDESNDAIQFHRNFLRHQILPLLKERYPNYPSVLLRTSRHMAEASLLLDELAELDKGKCLVSGKIEIDNLRKLSFPRAKNLLRYTLLQEGATLPSTIKLEEILKQLMSISLDNKFHVTFGSTEVRCYKGAVYVLHRTKTLEEPERYLHWCGEAYLTLPHTNGIVYFTQVKSQGIDQQKILDESITIRFRKGGEHFRPVCKRPRRSLKNLLQEACIPPWERNTLPLLFYGEKLIWVPRIGIDCEFQVRLGELGILPIWKPKKY